MDRQSVAEVVAVAAQVRGLSERGQRGVQARHESVVIAAAVCRLRPAGRAGEIRGGRVPGHIHVTRRRVDRQSVAEVLVAAAQVRGLSEHGQRGVQARHESVAGAAAVRRLRAAGRAGEIRGGRVPGHIHVTRQRVDRQSVADVLAAAAQVRGLSERGQRGVQVRHESVVDAAAVCRLCPTGRAGEIRGGRLPGHIHVTRRRVDRQSVTVVGAAAAQVRGLHQGIDHHGQRGIVAAQTESVDVAARLVGHRDSAARPALLLIRRGPSQPHVPGTRGRDQPAGFICPKRPRTGHPHPDPRRVRARLDREELLHVLPVGTQRQAHPGPHLPQRHPLIRGNAAPPSRRVVAEEVTDLRLRALLRNRPGQATFTGYPDRRFRQAPAGRGCRPRAPLRLLLMARTLARQGVNDLAIPRDEDRPRESLRVVGHRRIGLSRVGDERNVDAGETFLLQRHGLESPGESDSVRRARAGLVSNLCLRVAEACPLRLGHRGA